MFLRALKKVPIKQNFLLSIIIPLAIFLYFFNVMHHTLDLFQKDYMKFVCIGETFGWQNPIFWNPSPKLLFPNSDFEVGSLENWIALDKVFASQPTKQEERKFLPHAGHRPLLHQGKYYLSICVEPQETESGKQTYSLVSIPFIIKEEKIGFLISGRRPRGDEEAVRDFVSLEVDGQLVQKDMGPGKGSMELRLWDVKQWLGKEARILITTAYDWVSRRSCFHVDWFHYYQESRVDLIKKTLSICNGGYDGQFYYFIAYDPFLSRFKENPIIYRGVVDEPAYRFGRIGFPLLIKIFSLNNPLKYPEVMIWLILFSFLIGAFFLLKITQFFNRSPLWTFLYLLIPGFQLSLYRACPEPISLAFFLSGMYYYLKRKFLATSLLFAAALLVRETTGFFILAVILSELSRKRDLKALPFLIGSTLPFLLWKFFLTLRLFPCYGWSTFFSHPGNFTLPFSGFVALYKKILSGGYFQELTSPALAYPILLTIVFLLSLYFLWKKADAFSLGLLISAFISISLNYEKIWVHIDNGVRTTSELFVFLIIAFISLKERLKPAVQAFFVAFFVLVLLFNCFFLSVHPLFRAGFFLK